jgi:integrase
MVDATSSRAGRGSGSVRERTPGVWEIRVVVGFDQSRGRSVQRSFTVRGDGALAERRRAELVEDFGRTRVTHATDATGLRLVDLLESWLSAPHLWKHATEVSHTSVVRTLVADPNWPLRLVSLTQSEVITAIRRWQSEGRSVSAVSGRWLVLRSAISWAVAEGILRSNPLAGMRGPARPQPRRHHTLAEVRQILTVAETFVRQTHTDLDANPDCKTARRAAFAAERDLLLVRLAADSGARLGEITVLRYNDLDGRVLTIERGLSQGVLGSTKSSRTRRLTLGATTTALIDSHYESWRTLGVRAVFDWLFAPTPARETYMTAGTLSHRFRRLGQLAQVSQPALHRLRHGVATHLVDNGKLLKAQARLGHRDPSTTLRHYSHTSLLDDQDVADELDAVLNSRG